MIEWLATVPAQRWSIFVVGAFLWSYLSPGLCQQSSLNLQDSALAGKILAGVGGELLGSAVAPTRFDINPGLLLLAPRQGLTGGGSAYWIFNGATLTDPVGDPDAAIQQAFVISAAQDNDRMDDGQQIGDFNNDGLSDFLLRIRPISSPTKATAYLVFGSLPIRDVELSSLPSPDGLILTSDQASGPPGVFNLAGSGDFDGDGLADVVLGLPEGQGDNTRSGLVFILPGGSDLSGEINLDTLPSSRMLTIQGRQFEGYLGNEVAYVGDVNQDGFDDVLLGSLSADAYLIKGRSLLPQAAIRVADLTSADGTTFTARNALDSVGSAGDFNGDTLPDLAFASTDPPLTFLPSPRESGTAYVVYGGHDFSAAVDLENLGTGQGLKVTGFDDGDNVGTTVSGGGDVNGDGFDDLLIGAHLADPPGPASFLLFGGPDSLGPLSLPTLLETRGTALIPGNGGGIEQRPEFAGDLDGDGLDDLAIGDRLAGGGRGRVYVMRGNAQPHAIGPTPAQMLQLIANDDSESGLGLNDLFESGFSDPADALSGIAFLPSSSTGPGEWQTQQLGEVAWLPLVTGSTQGAGVLFEPSTRIRFLVTQSAVGFPPRLSVSLWDGRGDAQFLTEVFVDEIATPISPYSEPLTLSPPHVETLFMDNFEE